LPGGGPLEWRDGRSYTHRLAASYEARTFAVDVEMRGFTYRMND
jgi:hypothetical protein